MELIDMKLPPPKVDSKKDTAVEAPSLYNKEKYPYGLQLRLEKEQVDKIPSLMNYKVGDKVSVIGEGTIMSVRKTEQQGEEPRYSVEIQIEKIGCSAKEKKPVEKMSPKEYREARVNKEI